MNSDGTLARGSGVVSSERYGTGGYYVFFNRNLQESVPVATVASPSTSSLSWGVVQVSSPGNPDTNRIRVIAPYPPGTALDRPFSLSLFCGS